MRQYSLCSPPDEPDDYVVAVKLEAASRGGSAALHDQVEVGQELEISTPRNLLSVARGADRHVLVAAGIGVTPMISMAYHLHRINEEFELHYFARSREEAAIPQRSWTEAASVIGVFFHFGLSRDQQQAVLGAFWRHSPARLMCIPVDRRALWSGCKETASAVIAEDNIHIEHFQAGEATDTDKDTPFEVELDDEVYEVPAENPSFRSLPTTASK